jgi:dipeptidyl aminopeptidase/acylaminoacyl peptidase
VLRGRSRESVLAWIVAAAWCSPVASSKPRVSYEDLIDVVDVGVSMDRNASAGVAISPDGRMVAVETRRADVAANRMNIRWLAIALRSGHGTIDLGDGGEPLALSEDGVPQGYSFPQVPAWSADSGSIVFAANRDGQVQLWRSYLDGRPQEQVSHSAGNVVSYRMSRDGQKVYFSIGLARDLLQAAEASEARRGFLYDRRFAPMYRALKPIPDTDPTLYGQPDSALRVVELRTGTERVATATEQQEFTELQQPKVSGRPGAEWVRSAETGAAVWLENLDTSGLGLDMPRTVVAALDGNSDQPLICSAPVCTGLFEGLWLSETGDGAYFLKWTGRFRRDELALYGWSFAKGTVNVILKTRNLLQGCTRTRIEIVCAEESATSPRALVAIRLDSGARRTIYDPNRNLQSREFGKVVPLSWHDEAGTEGFGHLVLPNGYVRGKRYPLVIVQYQSRGFLRGGVGDEHPIFVLAAKGFAVLSFHRPIDPALQSSVKSWEEADRQSWSKFRDRRRVLSSLLAAVRLISGMEIADPQRVGISGLSDGANTASFALIHSPDTFAAAALAATRWNPVDYYLEGIEAQETLQEWGLGLPETNAEHWGEISVALNAGKIEAPLLIQASDREYLAETQTYSALREAGKAVELFVFPDEYHTKWQPAHKWAVYKRNVQWFEFWLQNVEEPDPVDPGQYGRWRQLRRLQAHQTRCARMFTPLPDVPCDPTCESRLPPQCMP